MLINDCNIKYSLYICTQKSYQNQNMKHCQYIGYPTQLYHLGIEGSSEFHPYAYTAECKMRKTIGNFFSTLEQHGYDVIQKKDGYLFEKALADLNECIKKSRTKEEYTTYTHLDIEDEICRCGKFIFMTRSPYYSEEKELDIEKGRGGKREGSGRKSNSQKLFISKTTTVRVPWNFKDNIKELCDFFIKKSTEGVDIKQVLSNASWQLHQKAEDYRTADYTSETTEGWARDCEQAEKLLLELGRMIPYVHLKEDEESNSK